MKRLWIVLSGVLLLGLLAGASYHFRWWQHGSAPEPAAAIQPSSGDREELLADGRPPRLPAAAASAAATAAEPPYDGPVWFREVTPETGIDFVHQSGTSAEKPFPAANGSGLAAWDYDRDGYTDLYFLTGTPFPVDTARQAPRNRVYRNLGAWKFAEVTDPTGLGHTGYSAGVAVGDYNADGFADLYVNCFGPNCLFLNQGDGTFLEVGQAAGVAHAGWGTSTTMLDYDDDGLLDVYVCNYGEWSLETNQWCGDRERGIRIYCSPTTVAPQADVLYRNLGDGTFADVSLAVGLPEKPGRGQGVLAADVNDDGRIDLYVANDMNPNMLLINRGGKFEDISEASGAAYDQLGRSQAGMGIAAGDLDGDRKLELFVTNFQEEHNTLYANLNGDFFQDVSAQAGLTAPSVAWVGWGTAFADFNLDGQWDLVLTNGHVDDNRNLLGQQTSYQQPPQLYSGKGRRFELLGAEAGAFFQGRYVGRGLVVGDLDNDGDQDVVIGHQDGPPALLRNEHLEQNQTGKPASVAVTLHGTGSNREAVGALLVFELEGARQVRQLQTGGSYLSSSELRQLFAWPSAAQTAELEIRWPSGILSQHVLDRSARNYDIWEPVGTAESASRGSAEPPES